MRIATYNVAAGRYCNKDLSIIAKQIEANKVECIGIQEVDYKTGRSHNADQLQEMKNDTMNFGQFNGAIQFDGGEYGLGFLSTYQVKENYAQYLESNGFEQRIYQNFKLIKEDKIISFYNTHVSFENTEVRAAQFATLKEVLDQDDSEYKILVGDFNVASEEEFKLFEPEYVVVNGYQGKWYDTFRGHDCTTPRIDNIILSKNMQIEFVQMDDQPNSDHNMLFVDVILK